MTSASDVRPIISFEVVPEHCIRNDQLELILGTPINQVIKIYAYRALFL